MAEICLACYNKLVDKALTKTDVLLTAEPYLCGQCGKFQRIVVITNDTYGPLLFRAPRRGSTTTKAPRKSL